MFRKTIFIMALLLLTAVTAYPEVKVNNHLFELGSAPSFKAGPDGVYLGYYVKTEDNTLYVKRVDRGLDKETPVRFEDMKGQFIDLSFSGDNIVLTWRPKKGDGKKYVYVQRSEDGGNTFKEPAVINSTTDALPPITTVTDGRDRLYVVWLDEREKHRLYMNYSIDGGRNFLKEDTLLTPDFLGANLPSLLLKDNRLDLFFLGVKKGENRAGIYHRYSEDGGKAWSEISAVQTEMEWGPFTITPVMSGNRIMLFWAGVEGLHGAYSDDDKKWNRIEFRETEGKDVYRLDVATSGESVYIATSWKTRLAIDEKPNVYFYKSVDNGSTWSGPQKLNNNEFNSTSSTFPVMGVSSDGRTILVAWQDHRDIRGSIYINYSKDGGKTWLDKDISLEKEPGKYNTSFPYIVNYRDRFYVLWFRFTNDRRDDADLYMEEVRVK